MRRATCDDIMIVIDCGMVLLSMHGQTLNCASYDQIDAKNLAIFCCIIEISIHRILMAAHVKVGLFKLILPIYARFCAEP